MKNLFNNLSKSEKDLILKQHSGGKSVVVENFQKLLTKKLGFVNPLLSEQMGNEDFLENSYVKPLVDEGFKQVNEINLPDGTYKKKGSGYRIDLMDGDGKTFTGYCVITTNGIRGVWNGEAVELTSKDLPTENVYKIFFKESGYKPKEAQTPAYTITENSLVSSQIPAVIINAAPPLTNSVGGKGKFKIEGSNDLYAYDLSSKLPRAEGEYYFICETSDYLNQNYPGKYNAKEGTQYCGLVDEDAYGNILYVNNDGKVVTGVIMSQ